MGWLAPLSGRRADRLCRSAPNRADSVSAPVPARSARVPHLVTLRRAPRTAGVAWPRPEDWETVDAQGRGRADGVDPADQWVLDPRTGEYEPRRPSAAPRGGVPAPRA